MVLQKVNNTGKILSAGSYILRFVVSDSDHGQRDVKADVTVQVTHLRPQEMRQAAPLTLAASSWGVVRPGVEVGSEHCFRAVMIWSLVHFTGSN